MNNTSNSLKNVFNDVSESSMGGAPFLIAYGATFLITAILSFFVPRRHTACAGFIGRYPFSSLCLASQNRHLHILCNSCLPGRFRHSSLACKKRVFLYPAIYGGHIFGYDALGIQICLPPAQRICHQSGQAQRNTLFRTINEQLFILKSRPSHRDFCFPCSST
jgi:hypothetical protein